MDTIERGKYGELYIPIHWHNRPLMIPANFMRGKGDAIKYIKDNFAYDSRRRRYLIDAINRYWAGLKETGEDMAEFLSNIVLEIMKEHAKGREGSIKITKNMLRREMLVRGYKINDGYMGYLLRYMVEKYGFKRTKRAIIYEGVGV